MTSIKAAIWKSLLFLVLFAVIIAVLVIPYMKGIDKQLPISIARLAQDFISVVSVLFATWIMTKYIDKRELTSIGFKNKNVAKDIFFGIILALFWVLISFLGQNIFGTIDRTSSELSFNTSFLSYTVALLLNAGSQEILCRGYLFQTIRKNIGLKTAVITTSLIFLLMHAGALQAGIIPSLNVFGAGIIFAIAYYKTGQLWLPITLHFVWNFMYSSILYKPISGYQGLELFQTNGSNLLAGGENGVEATIITTFTIIIVILIEQFFMKSRVEK